MALGVLKNALYLVGYSSNMQIYNVKCVISKHLRHENGWEMRNLNYMFPVVNIMRSWLSAKDKYMIRNYDDNSLVLSELTESSSPCSLWATRDYLEKILETTNRTFYLQCPDPVYTFFRRVLYE
ncbi:uncharacterized protein LOC119398617 [Rhipicephalus sanguineus]|uniref:uncharacterized protein LOC119398617 n=1 Tax=Rhipicephalus sanguineus TaxID=34632 RepID=UPI0018948ADF|nr:uncharacterized protein LOC119398617 [Rhipicephalus sanguineus]